MSDECPYRIEATPLKFNYPVKCFESMEDVRSYYWGPPKPDEHGQSRIALFVTVGSLRGWNTCGDGPVCSSLQ